MCIGPHRRGFLLALLAAAALPLHAQQQQEDEKVRLLNAQSAQLIEQDGQNFRKVIGPARFLHNNTYLLCDTALWNVNTNVIDAMGHVRIIQDRTQLSSETLQYVVDDNMAKFRGALVQLEDKDKNTLRTRYLDYNTKDSVAIFQDGAAMRDKDGQIIESIYGTYDSKANLFVFNDRVNMYLDTTFVKTSRLEYRSDLSTAYFGFGTDMWQDDKMLSANDGWYDRNRELFFFRRNVHVLTQDQETWADSLYYYRAFNDADLRGHVELMDTTRNVFALAGRFEYTDSLSQVRMTREPAIMSITEEKGRTDTLYLGGDLLLMRGIRRCDIPEEWTKTSQQRLKDISGDPVMEYRKKAAENAAKEAEEAAKKAAEGNMPNRPPDNKPKGSAAGDKPAEQAPAPPLQPPADTLTPPVPADTSAPKKQVDTLPPPPDTTKINFIWGSKRIRLFRRDLQMAADSMVYSDMDSLVRLYQDPIFFNEGNRQYASDSIYMVIKDKQMQKAHLLSNAFITVQEDPHSYDQIRGTEMVAYFDSTTALTRFDALGGASSLFFLEEQGALATVNKVDAKMIYATFKDGDIERMYYYDNPKNDGYPSVQLPDDDRMLKGFRWEPEKRPKSPLDVTTLVPRKSERYSYLARPHTEFKQTEIYFPGHIRKIYRDIAIRDSLQVVREQERQRTRQEEAQADTLAAAPVIAPPIPAETPESPAEETPPEAPEQEQALPEPPQETAPADTLKPEPPKELTPEEIKAREKLAREEAKKAEKAAKEAEKAARQAAREAKWAEKDRQYEARQAAKAQRKLEKERARKLKMLKKLEKKAQRERKQFERYLEKERQKALKKQQKDQ